jgi:hypothetical protein
MTFTQTNRSEMTAIENHNHIKQAFLFPQEAGMRKVNMTRVVI